MLATYIDEIPCSKPYMATNTIMWSCTNSIFRQSDKTRQQYYLEYVASIPACIWWKLEKCWMLWRKRSTIEMIKMNCLLLFYFWCKQNYSNDAEAVTTYRLSLRIARDAFLAVCKYFLTAPSWCYLWNIVTSTKKINQIVIS